VRRLAYLVAASALLAGCGGSSGGSDSSAPQALTVFAAASLRTTFTTLGRQFEQANPGTRVTFSFAGSSDLASQLTNGAPADVFASADQPNMAKVTDARLVDGTPTAFASNTLTIVVPPDNPARIASFADLARPGTSVVMCAPQVPCGSATSTVERLASTPLHPVSQESSVTDVLAKVTSGEADAGLVYVTDAKQAGPSATTIAFPEAARAVNVYPIAVLSISRSPDLARRFSDYVTGPSGQQVLRDAGFAPG
jgi:molybdate transport system substrate-binding protein